MNVEKDKGKVVIKEGVAHKVEAETKGKIIEVVSSVTYLGSPFSRDGGPQEGIEMRVGKGLKNLRCDEDDVKVKGLRSVCGVTRMKR